MLRSRATRATGGDSTRRPRPVARSGCDTTKSTWNWLSCTRRSRVGTANAGVPKKMTRTDWSPGVQDCSMESEATTAPVLQSSHISSASGAASERSLSTPLIALTIVLLAAAGLRLYAINWDDGLDLHPDELYV